MTASLAAVPDRPPLPRRRYVSRLDTVKGCRVEAARLLREAIRGQRPTGETYQLVLAIQAVSRMIQGEDLERRVEALEALLEGPR